MSKITLNLFLLLALTSCTKYKLTDEDIKCIPYNGNEKLYYKSSYGDIDSFILSRPDRYFAELESNNMFDFDKFEIVDFDYDRTDSVQSYYGNFVRLQADDDNIAFLTIYLDAKKAKLDFDYSISLKEYKELPVTKISTAYGTFSDVLIFYPKVYTDNPENINKLYWSKSKGLIRFDKKDSFWELYEIKFKEEKH